MRSTRIVGIVTALLLALGLGLVAASPAQAAKPPHNVTGLKAQEIRNSGKFFIAGKVTTYKNKRVILQKKNCGKCKYKRFKTDKTNAKGQFRINFDGPRGSCYAVYIPSTSTHAKFLGKVGCIVRSPR